MTCSNVSSNFPIISVVLSKLVFNNPFIFFFLSIYFLISVSQFNKKTLALIGEVSWGKTAHRQVSGRVYRQWEGIGEKWCKASFSKERGYGSNLTHIPFLRRKTLFFSFPPIWKSLTSEIFKFFWALRTWKGRKILSIFQSQNFFSPTLVCHSNIALREIVGKQASKMQFQQHILPWLAVKSKHRSCCSGATHLRLSVRPNTVPVLHD